MLIKPDGTPLASQPTIDAAQARMQMLMATVIACFRGQKVSYEEGADIGLNLILNYVKRQPTPQAAMEAFNRMQAALAHHGRQQVNAMVEMQGVLAANEQGQPS